MLFLTYIFPAIVFATYTIPRPQGRHAVSKVDDVLRADNLSDPYLNLPYRDIPISIFSAAGPNDSCGEVIVPYMPWESAEFFEAYLTSYTGGLPFNDTLSTTAATYCEPRVSPSSRPLVLFVPGAGFVRQFYQVLIATFVAQTGYTVVSLEQPGSVLIETFPNGAVESGSNKTLNPVRILVEDVEFVARALLENSSASPSPWLDPTRVGVFGHSQGGEVALTAVVDDSCLHGALDMDGFLNSTFLNFTSSSPFAILAHPGYNFTSVPSWSVAWHDLTSDKWLIELEQSAHATFGDFPYLVQLYGFSAIVKPALLAAIVGAIPGQEAVQVVATEVAAFFRYLFGASPAASIAQTAASLEYYRVLNESLTIAL